MEIAEVVDRRSLVAYFASLPQKERHDISLRVTFNSAARVLPIAVNGFLMARGGRKRELTPVSIFGALAISGVARRVTTPEILASAAALSTYSSSAASAAAAFASASTSSASDAAFATADAFASATTTQTLSTFAFSVASASAALSAVWKFDPWGLLRNDLYEDSGLWPDAPPDVVMKTWEDAQNAMDAHYVDWSIWVHWYNRVLEGCDWHPEAMGEILSNITRTDWDKGPEHINPIFDPVLALYMAEDEAVEETTPLARAFPVDYSFDALHRVMRMTGVDDNMKHLRDPLIVQTFLDDAEQLRDDLRDFADYAKELAPGGNYAGVLRLASEKVLKEFDRVQELTHLRAERLVLLGSELEVFAASEQGRIDLGQPLSGMLDSRIDNLKKLCRKHFGPSYQTLGPLAELHLDQIDQDGVLHIFDEAIAFIENLPNPEYQPLDYEGILVLQDMREELRVFRAAIAEASNDEFRELLKDRFAQSAGASGLSALRFLEKSFAVLGQGSDAVTKNYKRVKDLAGIFAALKGFL